MNKAKIKIIHLIGSLNPGGVQTYILNISNYDKAHHIDREVCTLYQEKGLLFDEFINNNVKISFCPITPPDKNWWPYFFWKKIRHISSCLFFFRLYRKLNTSNPDIIISDEPASLITQFFITRILNIPLIWNIHAERVLINNKNLFKYLFKYFFKNVTIISDSKYVLLKNLKYMQSYLNIDLNKIPIIHATVNLEKFLLIEPHNKIINNKKLMDNILQFGSIGRLNWAKGYELLIKALYQLKLEFSNFHLKIAGDGPLRNLLEDMIDKYSLRSNILILGEVKYAEIPTFLNSIDIYIQPSVSEGSPITIKEAMASALPILASNAGGIPEIIQNKKTGLLFKNEDIKHLEQELKTIINMSSAKRKEMGLEARNKAVKHFNIEKTTIKLVDVYRSVLKNYS